MLQQLISDLEKLKNPAQAKILQKFFKTGKGEYGEGDVFLGIMASKMRELAKKYKDLNIEEIQKLLGIEYNEARWIALVIWVNQYKKSSPEEKQIIFKNYLKNTPRINNWNLVDISAPSIVGDFLLNNYEKKQMIYDLAQSKNLWEKRIAIVSTYAFIRQNQFEETLKISEILISDKHDLIHKAVGWMLREVGKKNEKILEEFLKKYYSQIPRTTLRYAIEKFPEEKRKNYLKGKI
ncbi:MAG: DNA alkylation repair protein [Nanoarchaeota archaeon]|nr:DNA alkylation repair protein [Nanoarchaeota archaeon]